MTAPATAARAPETARETNGRFAKGNRGGPGNPHARQVAALRQAALEAVGPEQIKEIMNALVFKARTGDIAAARLVLSYTLGKPTTPPDPDRLDAEEWERFKETVPMFRELPGVVQAAAPELFLDLIRGTRHVLTDELAGKLHNMLVTGDVEKSMLGKRKPSAKRDNGQAAPSANGDAGVPASGGRQSPGPCTVATGPETGGLTPPARPGAGDAPSPNGSDDEPVEVVPLDGDMRVTDWYMAPRDWPRSAKPGPSPNGLDGQWRRIMPDDGDLSRPAEYIFIPNEWPPPANDAAPASKCHAPSPNGPSNAHRRSPNRKKRKKHKLPKRIKERMGR